MLFGLLELALHALDRNCFSMGPPTRPCARHKRTELHTEPMRATWAARERDCWEWYGNLAYWTHCWKCHMGLWTHDERKKNSAVPGRTYGFRARALAGELRDQKERGVQGTAQRGKARARHRHRRRHRRRRARFVGWGARVPDNAENHRLSW